MVRFLDIEDFTQIYDLDISKALSSPYYNSESIITDDYYFKIVPYNPSFIREICFLSQIDHPQIIKILDVSTFVKVDGLRYGIFSMPLALDLYKAFGEGLLTLQEIISDIVSILLFLRKYKIVHADIKINNFVYHNGKITLIDFGISRMALPYENGDDYYSELAYTEYFRDPEFIREYKNSIKTEIYAFCATIYYLLTLDERPFNKNLIYKEMPYFNFERIVDGSLLDFLNRCQDYIVVRDLKQLENHPYILKDRIIKGSFNYPNCVTNINLQDLSLFGSIVNGFKHNPLQGETSTAPLEWYEIFLALELYRNFLSLTDLSLTNKEDNLIHREIIYIFLTISQCFYNVVLLQPKTIDKFEIKTFEYVFNLFEGKFFNYTPWYCALNTSEFPGLIKMMFSNGYNFSNLEMAETISIKGPKISYSRFDFENLELPFNNKDLELIEAELIEVGLYGNLFIEELEGPSYLKNIAENYGRFKETVKTWCWNFIRANPKFNPEDIVSKLLLYRNYIVFTDSPYREFLELIQQMKPDSQLMSRLLG